MQKFYESQVWNDCILFLLNLISKHISTFNQNQGASILGLPGLQDVFSIKFFSISAARINCITVPNLQSHLASISHNCQRTSHDSPTPVGTSFYSKTMSLFSNTVLLTIWSHFLTLHNVVGTIISSKVLERNKIPS